MIVINYQNTNEGPRCLQRHHTMWSSLRSATTVRQSLSPCLPVKTAWSLGRYSERPRWATMQPCVCCVVAMSPTALRVPTRRPPAEAHNRAQPSGWSLAHLMSLPIYKRRCIAPLTHPQLCRSPLTLLPPEHSQSSSTPHPSSHPHASPPPPNHSQSSSTPPQSSLSRESPHIVIARAEVEGEAGRTAPVLPPPLVGASSKPSAAGNRPVVSI
jgi:hypothetical protein